MMKTKIVYVLVSSPDDCFYEQLLMSLYSLRLYNKDAFVELVVDKITNDTLFGFRSQIDKYVNKRNVVDVPSNYTQLQKSRYLKTNLRQLVNGDYFYIDLDTVICDDLSDVDKFTGNICATSNGNAGIKVSDSEDFEYMLSKAYIMGYDFIGYEYYNAGILYVKDNEMTRLFYQDWFDYYQKCVERGVDMDQISFCKVNALHHNFISHMPEEWNCQIQRRGLLLTGKKKIIHYYTNINPANFLLAERNVHLEIKVQQCLTEKIKKCLETPSVAFGPGKSVFVGNYFDIMGSCFIAFLRKHRILLRILDHLFSVKNK